MSANANPLPNTKRVWIIVLGDVGRSPRMQNHAKSFAENGHLVEIVGYCESRVNQVRKIIFFVYAIYFHLNQIFVFHFIGNLFRSTN
jgi:hypothetical protein